MEGREGEQPVLLRGTIEGMVIAPLQRRLKVLLHAHVYQKREPSAIEFLINYFIPKGTEITLKGPSETRNDHLGAFKF